MHSLTRRALALTAVLLGTSPVLADDCGKPDLLEAYPDVSEDPPTIPRNAVLTAHYAPTAQYLGEDVTLEEEGMDPVLPDVTFDETQGLLRATPPAPLTAGAHYTVTWPKLAGIGTASRGRGALVDFVGSAIDDVSSPDFEGLESVEWDVRRERDDCTDSLEDRFAFQLFPGVATDDFDVELLSVSVFQTAGPHVKSGDAPYPIATKKFPADGSPIRVTRAIDEGAGRVCFAALVRDLTGKASTGAEREVCTRTTRPPFFYGCSTALSRAPSEGSSIPWLLLSAAALGRRRRRP